MHMLDIAFQGMNVSGHMYGTDQQGIAFIGSEGTLVIDQNKWQLLPGSKNGQYLFPAMPPHPGNYGGLAEHVENFLHCIRPREKPRCGIESARNGAVNCQMGNIAFRTGQKVYWDDSNKTFLNSKDKEANALVRPNYFGPWKLPKIS
jgi:hypothetical protein